MMQVELDPGRFADALRLTRIFMHRQERLEASVMLQDTRDIASAEGQMEL